MKRTALFAAAAVALAPLAAAVARPDDPKPELPAEVACAVMPANKLNVAKATEKGMFADYEYTRYYFCCGGCPAQFTKDPEKFAKNAGVPLSRIPLPETIACAVMPDHSVTVKEATEKKLFADYNGRRYYFCCPGCPPQFAKEPAKFAKSASISLGQLPLPKEMSCAVMPDHKVNVAEALGKKMYADYKGRRYVFCCAGCPPQFEKDPAKFAAGASLPSPKQEAKKAE